ncbi:MAG: SMP-30/gluconolactonase/LRE family protein [Actinomycetota bacterium]
MSVGLEHLSTFVEGLDHPEAVTCTRDGVLYAGGEAGQVYRIDPQTRAVTEVACTGGFLLGLCADARDRLYCCDIVRKEVIRVDPASGDMQVYSKGTPDYPMVNPNATVFDDDGVLYVTESGHWKQNDGCIMRVDLEGTTTMWSRESTGFPNGAALSSDGRALYVLESTTPALVKIPINSDGSAGSREIVAMLPGTVPDGIAFDTEDRAYIFNYRPDRIDRVWPDGRIETLAEDSEGTMLAAPTNGVFLEPDRTRLIVASLGRWHLTECAFGATGIPLRYPDLP